MQVCVLGPLLVRDGATEVAAGGPLQRRVLARLAMDGGRPVDPSELEAAVWGDEPPLAARHTIASHVFRLRRLGLAIETADDRYVLRTPTDIEALERLAADGRQALGRGDRAAAESALRAALALGRGRPLADLEDLPEARIVASRLEELVEGLREELLMVELDGGRPPELVARARQLATEQPYRERRWALLMLILYRAGRQAEALDAYAECRRRLIDDLGLDPGSSLRRMQQAVLSQDPILDSPAATSALAAGTSLPPGQPSPESEPVVARIPGTSTRLIGRATEQRDLAEVWNRARLVTLLGPPGAGKTRLALELARTAPAPVWYVPLDQLPDSQSVAGAVLDAVAPSSRAIEALDGVISALRDKAGLIVLDGAEARLPEVSVLLDALLAACPLVRILATSRERVGLIDEAIVPVGSLAPEEALELLSDRARLVDPRFRLGPDDIALADRLCGLVDRLPLGIELVARHLQLLRLDEVVVRVESDLGRWAGGPIGGRAGLWAALDASVERLRPIERQALLGLAVMVADADLDLIGPVAGLGGDPVEGFETVARLVDASLVQVRSAPGPTRYELFRTVAGHTLESTAEADVSAARARYIGAVLERAAGLAGQLASAGRSETLRRLDREMPHIRDVLGRLTDGPADGPLERTRLSLGLETAVGLTDYWLGRHPAEGLAWIGGLLEAAAAIDDLDPRLRADALLAQAHLAYWVTDFARGAEAVIQAEALFAALGNPLGEGRALRRRGAIAAATDDVPAARHYLEASLARLEAAGVDKEIGTTLLHLGSLLADEGIVDEARPALERARRIAVATGDPLANGHVLAALNLAHWKAGDLDAAMQAGNEALLIFRELGHRPTEGTVANRLAAVARGLGRPRAARRYGELGVAAGEQSSTRTTIALGHLNLARLDLDAGDPALAAGHLVRALELIDPGADRWVLVDALEAVARMLVVTERPGWAELLAAAAQTRLAIRQPVAPTEKADREWTVSHGRLVPGGPGGSAAAGPGEVLGPLSAHQLAATLAAESARPAAAPRRRRARA
jgi:predicted ATPase/DNA-binding SARP family transcriptional activator/tetratricopeptide (TPR) repeat protein